MMRDTRQLSGHPCNPPIEVNVILSAASAKRSEALAKSKDPYHNDGTSMSEGVLAPRPIAYDKIPIRFPTAFNNSNADCSSSFVCVADVLRDSDSDGGDA